MGEGGHVCEDALWEGGDVVAMQGPEERRGCGCLTGRQSLENGWRVVPPSAEGPGAVRETAPPQR